MRLLQGDTNPEEVHFVDWLLSVGEGTIDSDPDPMNDLSELSIPTDMIVHRMNDLLDDIYPGIASSIPPVPEYFLNCMILAARNTDVSDMNEEILGKLAGQK
jgi:hypothetical protein